MSCNQPGQGLDGIINTGVCAGKARKVHLRAKQPLGEQGNRRDALFHSNLPDPLCSARDSPDQFSCLSGLSESLYYPSMLKSRPQLE